MKCGYPIEVGPRMVPCGQCMPCRINHKRQWTGRILLEAAHVRGLSTFLTLTYNEEHVPHVSGSGDKTLQQTLRRKDADEWFNRIRGTTGIGPVRFFMVGEYGDQTQRPHYHAVLFGIDPGAWEDRIHTAWRDDKGEPIGFTQVAPMEKRNAAYIAGYVTKKMTQKDDPRLTGREREFSTMSRRPPIGAAGMIHIRNMFQTKHGSEALAAMGDIPTGFRFAGGTWPIGRYWRKWLRQELGILNPPINREWEIDYDEWQAETDKAEQRATWLWNRSRRRSRGQKL